jgi:eukaryotic-like serine/threonine-protein kinase
MEEFPRRWGTYVLIRPLGGGGMGDVFLALQGRPGRERLCVVKRLIPGRRPDQESLERFRREAEIVRTLAHGAIAQTLAIDELDGEPCIVQEFIEGRNLAQLTSAARSIGEAIPHLLAIHIVREVARALAYAHRTAGGIVHRDVAPDNIMVTFSGETRLIDFGLARGGSDPALTRPGVIIGRYSYTAPEMLAGATADRRADIYSLGVVLWQLLTGRDPTFVGLEAPPPPSALKQTLPNGLDEIVMQALAAEPDNRYATAEELQRALGAFLPQTFLGEQALADFIGRCYDVEVQRRRLRDEIDQARPLLADTTTIRPPAERAFSRRPIVWASGAATGLAVFLLVAVAVRGLAKPSPAEGPLAVASSSAPPGSVQSSPARHNEAPVLPPRDVPTARSAESLPRRSAGRASAPSRRDLPATSAVLLLDRARDSLLTGDLMAAERDARDAFHGGTAVQRARAHVLVGQVLVLRGQPSAAADEFTEAIRLDPANEAAAAALARLRRQRGNP